MDDDDYRKALRATESAIKHELLHRDQIQELELRKALAEAKTAEIAQLIAEVTCGKALGLPVKHLRERFERMTGGNGDGR